MDDLLLLCNLCICSHVVSTAMKAGMGSCNAYTACITVQKTGFEAYEGDINDGRGFSSIGCKGF